eukprot:m.1226133 g.1226133  ORF g.1226133 m.1226133 type:complete len:420 (+) comp24635_c0_seq25:413-1672(+)
MASSENPHCSSSFGDDEFRLSMCDNCMELIPQSDMTRHASTCGSMIWGCPECGLHVNVAAKADHINSHLTMRCELCGDSIDNTTSMEHASICTMRPSLCQWCSKPFPFLEKPTHELECGGVEEQCPSCAQLVIRSLIVPHLSSNCLLHKRAIDESAIPVALEGAQVTPSETATPGDSLLGNTPSSSDLSVTASVERKKPLSSQPIDAADEAHVTLKGQPPENATTTPSDESEDRTQQCKICGETYSLRVLMEHTKLCEVICRSTISNRPFSRGSPLPGVGLPSSARVASTVPSTESNEGDNRRAATTSRPLKPARTPSGKRSGASPLFTPLVVPSNAPTTRQKPSSSAPATQGSRTVRRRKQQAKQQTVNDATSNGRHAEPSPTATHTLGASLTVYSDGIIAISALVFLKYYFVLQKST